jgi:nitroimidazol reductase NimA-like FMN-containing flavoprotein (pyridoxamine 5'-phosphate oxidase superfamily)
MSDTNDSYSSAAASYPETGDNRPSRHAERARYDEETVHRTLDEALIAHVAFVADGKPTVLPMLYVREGRAVYLHGSTGMHLARTVARRGSVPVAVEVTIVDELVLARSTFSHSANYRSVVVHGDAAVVRDDERKAALLGALVEKLIPGRSADARPPAPVELRQTAVLEVRLENVSAKVRTGDPLDEPQDAASDCWAGVRPIVTGWGEPRPAAGLRGGIELPPYLAAGGSLALPV